MHNSSRRTFLAYYFSARATHQKYIFRLQSSRYCMHLWKSIVSCFENWLPTQLLSYHNNALKHGKEFSKRLNASYLPGLPTVWFELGCHKVHFNFWSAGSTTVKFYTHTCDTIVYWMVKLKYNMAITLYTRVMPAIVWGLHLRGHQWQ